MTVSLVLYIPFAEAGARGVEHQFPFSVEDLVWTSAETIVEVDPYAATGPDSHPPADWTSTTTDELNSVMLDALGQVRIAKLLEED